MKLEMMWKKYLDREVRMLQDLPEEVRRKGKNVVFEPSEIIVSRGEFPRYIYFIEEGKATGLREYIDGSSYNYFLLDQSNGAVGLLEVLSGQNQSIATVCAVGKVKAVKIESAIVYEAIMQDIELIRKCTVLLANDLYKRSGNDGLLYYVSGIDRVRMFFVSFYQENVSRGHDKTVTVNVEYKDIASRIGMSERTVGRNIRKLKETGEILSVKKKIILGENEYRKLVDNIDS